MEDNMKLALKQQFIIIKKMLRIVKRKQPKTLKGCLTRAFILNAYAYQLQLLRLKQKNYYPIPDFAKGGIVINNIKS